MLSHDETAKSGLANSLPEWQEGLVGKNLLETLKNSDFHHQSVVDN